jgi:hypothetical protein
VACGGSSGEHKEANFVSKARSDETAEQAMKRSRWSVTVKEGLGRSLLIVDETATKGDGLAIFKYCNQWVNNKLTKTQSLVSTFSSVQPLSMSLCDDTEIQLTHGSVVISPL